jgi:isopenicillin-N epimerase
MTMPADLRDQFLLDPDVVFLNHGSFGACPRPVFERYQALQRELECQPVDFLGRRFAELMAEARLRLAIYVGTTADNLVYVPNATTGVNIVARSLSLAPGDEVVATDHEYGACDRVWRYLCGQRRASYRRATVSVPVTTPERAADEIWSAVTDRTRVLFLSHITSPTALVFPVAELCARARSAGILTVIDGAHGPGQVDLQLDALGADFYTGNCHKWLCAPKGAAFLYARPEVQPLLAPLVIGWGWESEKPGPSRFIDEQEWTGTRDYAACLAVPAAIDFQAAHDWPTVRQACHELLRRARAALLDLLGTEALHPDDPAWYAQMLTVELPAVVPDRPHAEAFQAELYERFRVEIPVFPWNDRSYLRVSIQAYNRTDDIGALLTALKTCLPAGRR